MSYDRYQQDADRLLDLIQRVLAAISDQEEKQRKAQEETQRKAQEEADRKAREVYLKVLEEQRSFEPVRVAILQTSPGRIVAHLWPNDSPTVQMFVELAEGSREWTDPRTGRTTSERLYDGVIFYEVHGPVIKAGVPEGVRTGYRQVPRHLIKQPWRTFEQPWLLAMPKSDDYTYGSHFSIIRKPWMLKSELADLPSSFGEIFGEVVEGGEVVDAIREVRTDKRDQPVTDVVLESVVIGRHELPRSARRKRRK